MIERLSLAVIALALAVYFILWFTIGPRGMENGGSTRPMVIGGVLGFIGGLTALAGERAIIVTTACSVACLAVVGYGLFRKQQG